MLIIGIAIINTFPKCTKSSHLKNMETVERWRSWRYLLFESRHRTWISKVCALTCPYITAIALPTTGQASLVKITRRKSLYWVWAGTFVSACRNNSSHNWSFHNNVLPTFNIEDDWRDLSRVFVGIVQVSFTFCICGHKIFVNPIHFSDQFGFYARSDSKLGKNPVWRDPRMMQVGSLTKMLALTLIINRRS